jgi:hypothetical protein
MNTIQQHEALEWHNEYWWAIDKRDSSLLCEVLASHKLPCTHDSAERLMHYALYERRV